VDALRELRKRRSAAWDRSRDPKVASAGRCAVDRGDGEGEREPNRGRRALERDERDGLNFDLFRFARASRRDTNLTRAFFFASFAQPSTVPESVLKKRKRDEQWAAQKAAAAAEAKASGEKKREEIFKRAEKYVKEYRDQVSVFRNDAPARRMRPQWRVLGFRQ